MTVGRSERFQTQICYQHFCQVKNLCRLKLYLYNKPRVFGVFVKCNQNSMVAFFSFLYTPSENAITFASLWHRRHDVQKMMHPMTSANSGNLINHWSVNWAQFKDPISHKCLAGTVVAYWSFTQEVADSSPFTVMTNILPLNSANSGKNLGKTQLAHQYW